LLQSGALYKSSNGGVNWQSTGTTFPVDGAVAQIVVNPQTPTTIYLWSSYVIYRSTDGAQSWQRFLDSQLEQLCIGLRAGALATERNLRQRFLDLRPRIPKHGRRLYVDRKAPPNVFAYGPTAMAVDPAAPSTVWLVNGGANIFRSTDSGASFQMVTTLSGTVTLRYPRSPSIPPTPRTSMPLATVLGFRVPGRGPELVRRRAFCLVALRCAVARLHGRREHTADRLSGEIRCHSLAGDLFHVSVDRRGLGIALDAAGDVYLWAATRPAPTVW
jgi:hypothetical protein